MKLDRNHVFLTSANDIDQICNPLKKLGITYFSYTRSEDSGERVYLSNFPCRLEYYFANQQYLIGHTESSPTFYEEQFIFWSTLPRQFMYDDMRGIGIDHGVYLVLPAENYCEFFAFAGDKNNHQLINTYINNYHWLKKFALYFKEQAKPILTQANKVKIILPFSSKSIDFVTSFQGLDELLTIKNQPKLSRRQVECAGLLIQGKTYKEIAKEIGLSPRTVETYLNNLKLKLECNNKAELISMLTSIIK